METPRILDGTYTRQETMGTLYKISNEVKDVKPAEGYQIEWWQDGRLVAGTADPRNTIQALKEAIDG